MTSLSKTELDGRQKLEEELVRLKKILNRRYELNLKWIPSGNDKLSGEVRGNTILIYDEDIETALETLRHEMVDYVVSEIIEPYAQVTNKLIALLNERAYQQKERLVERLVGLV